MNRHEKRAAKVWRAVKQLIEVPVDEAGHAVARLLTAGFLSDGVRTKHVGGNLNQIVPRIRKMAGYGTGRRRNVRTRLG